MIEDDDSPSEKTFVGAFPSPPAAPPPAEQVPHLVVVAGRSVGRAFELRGEMIIGRSPGVDILLEEEDVSRRHAKVVVSPGGPVEIVDLGSTNGTFCNNQRIHSQVLEEGEKIRFGGTAVLRLAYEDELDEALQKNLYESATRDGLTRLYNRKFLYEMLSKEFAYAHRHQAPLSLLMIDVDHLAHVNETYGAPTGDYVLQRLAQRVVDTLRAEDLAARLGGDELTVLLRETAASQALLCAERIRRVIEREEFTAGPSRILLTVSIGVATFGEGSVFNAALELLTSAERALDRAKALGCNRVEGPPSGG